MINIGYKCNGVYGASKDRNNPCYDPLMSNLTCIFGQLFILDVIDKIEAYCRLLQTNTDGIFVLCENEEMKNKVIEIIHSVGKRLRMRFEIDEYTKLIQKDVNNYIAVMKNGKLECKGAMVKTNKPIDNDLPILNDAVRMYLAYDKPIEETINECNELIKFQKVIKLSSKFKEVWYGKGVYTKLNDKTAKVTSIDGQLLRGKVHRVFASTRQEDGSIYKLKIENGNKSYEKFANTPDRLFIDNEDIHDKTIPDYLDKEYYIKEAKKRVSMFLTKEEEKIDKIPNILFNCMCRSNDFYSFLEKCYDEGITKKVLEGYLIADCCNIYGKTDKLIKFKHYFDLLYKKNKLTTAALDKKFNDEYIKDIIKENSSLTKSGKSYIDIDYKTVLLKIFDSLENKDINPYLIMKAQIEKFNEVRYKDESLNDNRWFVLNTRNVIAPNIIIYNMKTGDVQYRKIDKMIFDILPLQDGDIIDVLNSQRRYAKKIVGKDDNGINIIEDDVNNELDVITQYNLMYRDFSKSKKSLLSDSIEYEVC